MAIDSDGLRYLTVFSKKAGWDEKQMGQARGAIVAGLRDATATRNRAKWQWAALRWNEARAGFHGLDEIDVDVLASEA